MSFFSVVGGEGRYSRDIPSSHTHGAVRCCCDVDQVPDGGWRMVDGARYSTMFLPQLILCLRVK